MGFIYEYREEKLSRRRELYRLRRERETTEEREKDLLDDCFSLVKQHPQKLCTLLES